jgi:copper homeostasis protein
VKNILEIAVFDKQSALLASSAGCDRIELCDNYEVGGITVSHEVLKIVREKISIPVFPIIRPRGGNFFYTDREFEVMKNDISLCKELKFEGVVFGILNKNKTVDIKRNSQLAELAYPLQTTFHRAFDETEDAFQSLEDIIKCGCKRILTSGQKQNALEGVSLLKRLSQQANNRITIISGGSIRSDNIANISANTGISEFHSSAKKESTQNDSHASQIYIDEIKAMKNILNSL